jgi:large subunit ribosomal protein L15
MGKYLLKKPEHVKDRKRVGRGTCSGHGKTSCRGTKGQLSRSGSKRRAGFEGGQMPLQRRIPKRGFNNKFRVEFQVVNISQMAKLDMVEIDPATMKKSGLIRMADGLVKVLGTGDLNKSVTIIADAFSKSAQEKILKAGGKANLRKSIEQKPINKGESGEA